MGVSISTRRLDYDLPIIAEYDNTAYGAFLGAVGGLVGGPVGVVVGAAIGAAGGYIADLQNQANTP